jgi:acetyl esterase/lipase
MLIAGLGLGLLLGTGDATADTGATPMSNATRQSHVSPGPISRSATSQSATSQSAVSAQEAKARTPRFSRIDSNERQQLRSTPLPAAATGSPARGGFSRPAPAPAPAVGKPLSTPSTSAASSGVTGVQVGHSDLTIPDIPGTNGTSYTALADWYFPTQSDGSVDANGVIWFQHGFLANSSFYSKLATQLSLRTNSIVVAPTLPSFPTDCSGCWLSGIPMQRAVADMFLGERTALVASAVTAGYQGTLPEQFILTGHSAGGGFAAAVAGFTVDNDAAADGKLRGVVMFDGVSAISSLTSSLHSLDSSGVPLYQIAAPSQMWNVFGATTTELLELRPAQFTGVVLTAGSHVDSMLGSVPLADAIAQLITRPSPTSNTAAVYTLSSGWINDMYAGVGPTDPQFGFYSNADQTIILGSSTAVALPTPEATQLPGLEKMLQSLAASVVPDLFGSPSDEPNFPTNTDYGASAPTASNRVTGVRTGHSMLNIPCGPGDSVEADWYLPTQADGSIQANGVIWMQHGLLGDKTLFGVLASELAQRTNSIVVAPTITSAPLLCTECWVDGVGMSRAIAELFVGDREALNASAAAAGYQGGLPQNFIFAGHSVGGGIAAAVGGFSVQNGSADGHLLGVVMFDGVSLMVSGTDAVDTFPDALANLDLLGIPVYQIAASPQTWNALGLTTNDLTALHPNQFVGVSLQGGSHSDAILDSKASGRYALLFSNRTRPGNTAAVYTLTSGWINDMYVGAGPDDPRFGIYGTADQDIKLGSAIGVVLSAATPLAA